MKLTAKQQAWIDYYKQGHTATEAARLAGYKAKSDKAFGNIGSENLDKLGSYITDRDAVLEAPRIPIWRRSTLSGRISCGMPHRSQKTA